MALDTLKANHPDFDYELIGWSEIDKYAIQMHNVFYPEYKDRNYGDISKIDWAKVPDFDLFTFSFPCFVAGTLVLTSKGYVPIEDINDGHSVLTHRNQYMKVVAPMRHNYDGMICKIKAMSFDELVCTDNHPLYVRKRKRIGHKGIRTFEPPKWLEAKEVDKSYYLGYAINKESLLPIWTGVPDNRWGHHNISNRLCRLFENKTFWYLIGRYIGDGWKKVSKVGNGIVICCSERNRDTLLECIRLLGYKPTIVHDRTVDKVYICSNELNAFVSRYGYKAHGKRIDGETLNLPIELLDYLIKGYLDSDGYTNGMYHKLNSVSRELIYGIAQCIAKCYHRPFSIYKTVREKTTIVEGRVVNQRDTYTISWKDTTDKQDNSFYEDGYIWFPINDITKEFVKDMPIYNMEVEKDNSYTANGAIVHNCQSVSAAGLQHGFAEGSGTRSSLLWECRKAIVAKHPKWLLMENVKNLVSKKFMPNFQKWLDFLTSEGYTNHWQVTNAKNYGIPQNRERVFCVSILNPDRPYVFPSPIPSELRIRDMLDPENEVDGKYYIDQDKTDKFVNKNWDKIKTMIENEED